MDWALDLDAVADALGAKARLPSPEEFASLITTAELGLLSGAGSMPDQLIDAGWYLHAVASAWGAPDLYPLERRRHAFQLSAHIFDLALQVRELDETDGLRLAFAAQIGFARSSLEPNAIAVRHRRQSRFHQSYLVHPAPSLDAGGALLAFDVSWLFDRLRSYREELGGYQADWGVEISQTLFASSAQVLEAVWQILLYLVRGEAGRLNDAERLLRAAIASDPGGGDIDSKWVAAHLLNALPDIRSTAVWAALPPNVPAGVRRAFTLAAPHVLQLWPPQLDAMRSREGRSATTHSVRRLVLSMPTSAGKTLLAQLLATTHLATEATGVCFVAPTRALCREIDRSLRSRLRFMRRETVFDSSDDLFTMSLADQRPDVSVMTPERLSYLLRHDVASVLSTYGLFIFDEVHNVGDPGRGWTLEAVISQIHAATRDTEHRLVLMSAALGNRIHFVEWVDPASIGLSFDFDWRGPRRLTAVYTAEAVPFDQASALPRPRANSPERRSRSLIGVLRVRTPDGRVTRLRLTEPVGQLITRLSNGTWTKDPDSPAFYKSLAPLVVILADAGPVLVVCPSRRESMDTAKAIASLRPKRAGGDLAVQLERRLGADHPLTGLVASGVAYHHGSLPRDVQSAVEGALADGHLDVVVATTTLTEGVNLPVRTVVIASQGTYGPGGFAEYITGATMLNAIGRAGRAARETEGWVVLARNAGYAAEDFERLNPTETQLASISNLASAIGLEELAKLEEAAHERIDVEFENFGTTVDSFIGFIWYLCRHDPASVELVLESTLAWRQLTAPQRRRWGALATRVRTTFEGTSESSRERWAESGFSLASARVLEGLSRDVARDLVAAEAPTDLASAGAIVLTRDRLEVIMQLNEAPPSVFRRHRSALRTIETPREDFLRDWIDGTGIGELADRYLRDVTDRQFRLEQTSDFTTAAFENHLPWAVGAVLDWAIQLEPEIDTNLLRFIPAAIRYGVNNPEAASMLRRGLQSRPLAVAVSTAYRESGSDGGLREWLTTVDIGTWAGLFEASPADLRDLLEFARRPGAGLLAALLEGEDVSVPIASAETVDDGVALARLEVREDRTPIIDVWADRLVGSIPVEHHADIATLVATGLPLSGELRIVEDQVHLVLRMAPLSAERSDLSDAEAELESNEEGATNVDEHRGQT